MQAAIGFLKSPRGANYTFVGPVVDEKVLGIGAGIGLRKEDTDLKAKIDGAILEMVRTAPTGLASKYFDFDIYGG